MSLLNKQQRNTQRKLEAKVQAMRNAEKSKNCIKAGQVPSQWGKVVSNEQRLIDNGHFMKTSDGASLDHARERHRDEKNRIKYEMSHDQYRHHKRMGTLPLHVEKVEK